MLRFFYVRREQNMKTYFDEFLGKEVTVQEEITPEIGKELRMEDPAMFSSIFEDSEEGDK